MTLEFTQPDIDQAMRALSRCKLTYNQEQLALRRIGRAVIKQAKKMFVNNEMFMANRSHLEQKSVKVVAAYSLILLGDCEGKITPTMLTLDLIIA